MYATPGDTKSNLGLGGTLESCIESISAAGFDAIELNLLDPTKIDVARLLENFKPHGLEISALATGLTHSALGWSFTDRDRTIREKTVTRIQEFIKLASKLDVETVVVGRVRGRLDPTADSAQQKDWVYDCMQACAKSAEQYGVRLAIESMSKTVTNIMNTIDETLKFLERLASPNVGILADTWHMNSEEDSIMNALVEARSHLYHVHFADNQRRSPGTGSIHFGEIINTLKTLKYTGYITVECLPLPNPTFMLQKSSSYLRSLLI